jgi:hypothetical protein
MDDTPMMDKGNVGRALESEREDYFCNRPQRQETKTSKVFVKNTICPYCGKEGGKNAMTRYHFDNCKENDGIHSREVRSAI